MIDTEVADADFVHAGRRCVCPDTRVQAWEDPDRNGGRQPESLAAGHRDDPLVRDAETAQDPSGLVRTDNPGSGPLHYCLGAPEVVEVRVSNQYPVALVYVRAPDSSRRRGGNAVEVRVQEEGQTVDPQSKGRASKPIDGCRTAGHHVDAIGFAPPTGK